MKKQFENIGSLDLLYIYNNIIIGSTETIIHGFLI